MRNLKRALSLAMASVMVLGLMVVGTGASYQDVASDDNKEAIEVLQTVGVMVGDDKGNFNPDQNVTRNEMAVIMANLMDYRVASYSGTSPFTDVPSWAEPYVAACYTNGITSGISATKFGGDQTVTTAQAALMLMKALGYFQYQSDFDSDWQLATISQGNKIDLFADVDSGVREAMTRNDVAQLVLNTLKSGMVEADDDTIKVDAGDVTVEAGKVKYNYITSAENYARSIKSLNASGSLVNSGQTIVELGEKLYQGDLKMKAFEYDSVTKDNFGAPATRWNYKNVEVGTYAESADYTFTGVVKSNAMYDAVGKTAADSYTWNVYMDGSTTAYKADGVTAQPLFTKAAVKANDSKDLDGTVRGATTYVYLNDAGTGTVTVCIVNTYAAEVTKVEDGTITLSDADLEFDVEGYDEEDVVLFTKSTNDGVNYSVESILGVAERVEGEATTVRVEDRVVVGDTTYRYSYRFNDEKGDMLGLENVDQTVAFYLDKQGNIIMIDDAVESNDFAYVYSIGMLNQYGDQVYGAKLIFTDGTSKNVTLDSDSTDAYATGANDAAKLANVQAHYVNTLVSYSVENDTYSIEVEDTAATYGSNAEDVIKSGAARINTPSGTIYADKNTAFLINDASDDNDDFNAYVGYNNVPNVDVTSGTSKVLAYVNSKGVAKAVVIVDGGVSGTNEVVFVVGNNNIADGKVQGTGTNKYYVFDAVVKGEATSIAVKYDTSAGSAFTAVSGLSKGEIGVFFGMTENSNGYVTKLTETTPTDVQVNGWQNKTAGANYDGAIANGDWSAHKYVGTKRVSSGGNLTFDTAGSPVSIANNKDAVISYYDGSALEISSSLKTDNNDEAYVVTDDGVIMGIFVFEK